MLIFISGALEFAPFTLQSQPLTQTEEDSLHAGVHPGNHISSTCLVSFNILKVFFLKIGLDHHLGFYMVVVVLSE